MAAVPAWTEDAIQGVHVFFTVGRGVASGIRTIVPLQTHRQSPRLAIRTRQLFCFNGCGTVWLPGSLHKCYLKQCVCVVSGGPSLGSAPASKRSLVTDSDLGGTTLSR
jgi:hypothetical protein